MRIAGSAAAKVPRNRKPSCIEVDFNRWGGALLELGNLLAALSTFLRDTPRALRKPSNPDLSPLSFLLRLAFFVPATGLHRTRLLDSPVQYHTCARLPSAPTPTPLFARNRSPRSRTPRSRAMGLTQDRVGKLLKRAEVTLEVEEVLNAYIASSVALVQPASRLHANLG